MIKVQAKDQGGNTSDYAECATNIDVKKPLTPIAALIRNNDETYNISSDMKGVKEIVSNNCCDYVYDKDMNLITYCNKRNLSIGSEDKEECTFSYKAKPSATEFTFVYYLEFEDYGEWGTKILAESEKKVSGVSGTYKVYETCYKNNSVVANDVWKFGESNPVRECKYKDWDKETVVISDKAGNVSNMLTVYLNKE